MLKGFDGSGNKYSLWSGRTSESRLLDLISIQVHNCKSVPLLISFNQPLGVMLAESNEFILYAVRSSIHRYDLATGTDTPLPLTGLREAVALDFDYDRNCLYWADISLDTIQVFFTFVLFPFGPPADAWRSVSYKGGGEQSNN